MEISLRTACHAIQGLLIELKDLEDGLKEDQAEDSVEDMLMLEQVSDALDELATVYTEDIRKNNIINFPSFEKMKYTIMQK